jgi:hypothetical protein
MYYFLFIYIFIFACFQGLVGVFIATAVIIDRIRLERVVDIFTTV